MVSKIMSAAAPKGFTLLELVLSLSIIAVLAAVATPFYLSYQTSNDFHVAVETTVQSLRRAQALAQGSDGDSSWGVHFESGSITLFQGVNFSSRNPELDESTTIPQNIVLSGLSDIVFAKFSGLPVASGTVILTSSRGEVENVVVNAKGMIEY